MTLSPVHGSFASIPEYAQCPNPALFRFTGQVSTSSQAASTTAVSIRSASDHRAPSLEPNGQRPWRADLVTINTQYLDTPYGELILGSFAGKLCLCDWRYRKRRGAIDARIGEGLKADFREQNDSLLDQTRTQLRQYFEHRRKSFDLPLLPIGSEFQKSVWSQLLQIPFGQTSTYLQLARALGNEKAVRAVASANGANAISIIVPCHRVIGSNGQLVGYAGGIKTKADLLGLEFDLFA